jgi:hypothetical protein
LRGSAKRLFFDQSANGYKKALHNGTSIAIMRLNMENQLPF